MGNNGSRPTGPHSRSRYPQDRDRAFPKRSFTTRGRGKYDRYDYDDEPDRDYPPPLAHHNPFPGLPMPQAGPGYYVRASPS